MTKVGKLRIEDKVIQLYPQNKCKDQYPTQTDDNQSSGQSPRYGFGLSQARIDLKKVV